MLCPISVEDRQTHVLVLALTLAQSAQLEAIVYLFAPTTKVSKLMDLALPVPPVHTAISVALSVSRALPTRLLLALKESN